MAAVGSGDASTPVVLAVPSPARWFAIAARQAGAAAEAPEEPRHVEAAAMYVADLLRIFATARVDALLLDEGSTPQDSLADVDGYRPVLNVAAHYQWPVWVRSDDASCWPRGEIGGVAGWLGRSAPEHSAGPWGLVLEADPAREPGAPPVTGGGAVLAVVPEAADPEPMMRWVRALA
jgi:hypothetical protein